MRNSLTRLRVFLEGLTFGLLETIHWSRVRTVDLSIIGPGDTFIREPTQFFPCWLTFAIRIVITQLVPVIVEEETQRGNDHPWAQIFPGGTRDTNILASG